MKFTNNQRRDINIIINNDIKINVSHLGDSIEVDHKFHHKKYCNIFYDERINTNGNFFDGGGLIETNLRAYKFLKFARLHKFEIDLSDQILYLNYANIDAFIRSLLNTIQAGYDLKLFKILLRKSKVLGYHKIKNQKNSRFIEFFL